MVAGAAIFGAAAADREPGSAGSASSRRRSRYADGRGSNVEPRSRRRSSASSEAFTSASNMESAGKKCRDGFLISAVLPVPIATQSYDIRVFGVSPSGRHRSRRVEILLAKVPGRTRSYDGQRQR